MPNRPAVLVVLGNADLAVFATGGVEVAVVNFDSIRDYETATETVKALLRQVEQLPEGDNEGFRIGRRDAILGLTHCETMTIGSDDEPVATG